MEGVNNKNINNLSPETALHGYFFPQRTWMWGGPRKGKVGFCFWFISSSQVNVRALHLKEGGMERQ